MMTVTRLAMAVVTAMTMVACGGAPGPVVTALQVSPSTVNLEQGATAPMTAVAVYSDGSTQDVTAQVHWDTSDSNVAAFNQGAVEAYAAGAIQLTASWNGHVASAAVQVSPALTALFGLAASPTQPDALAMMGLYSDGSIQPVDLAISWTSTAADVLTISDAGVLTAVAPGLATIRVTVSGLLFTINVRVNADLSLSIGG